MWHVCLTPLNLLLKTKLRRTEETRRGQVCREHRRVFGEKGAEVISGDSDRELKMRKGLSGHWSLQNGATSDHLRKLGGAVEMG